ncbi:MAG: AroM family protein [Devosia sp.]|nr:AroM family protein [Devosia sp.]
MPLLPGTTPLEIDSAGAEMAALQPDFVIMDCLGYADEIRSRIQPIVRVPTLLAFNTVMAVLKQLLQLLLPSSRGILAAQAGQDLYRLGGWHHHSDVRMVPPNTPAPGLAGAILLIRWPMRSKRPRHLMSRWSSSPSRSHSSIARHNRDGGPALRRGSWSWRRVAVVARRQSGISARRR